MTAWPYYLGLDLICLLAVITAFWWRVAGHRMKWWVALVDRAATYGLFGFLVAWVISWGRF